MNDSEPILTTHSLSIGYDAKKPIFSGIRLSAGRGELVSLIGPNGVGKSTLLRTLLNLQPPLSGSVRIYDHPVDELSRADLAKKISFVSTDPVKVANLTVTDLVALGRFPHTNWLGKQNSEDRHKVDEAVALVNLSALANKSINEISDGEKQRAMVARALAQDTGIIVLDEPTAFLDLANRYEIVQLLNRLSKEKKKTIIFSSHELSIAIREADKIWLMLPGKIIEGAPEDLIIGRSFEEIFDTKKLMFDNIKGDFRVIKVPVAQINLTGEGLEYTWTKNALERVGYEVTCNKTGIENVIVKIENGNTRWTYQKNQSSMVFDSIYQLIKNVH